ncbi:hypothetical protein NFI96_009002 [Prochilodus magdalenae]|nr:hypothetical protein NFI96_009002 [Prochilodus magdalenae]
MENNGRRIKFCRKGRMLIAVYEAMDLQQRAAASPGGSVASGYSSPEPSEPELGGLQPGSEIEVTPNTLKSSQQTWGYFPQGQSPVRSPVTDLQVSQIPSAAFPAVQGPFQRRLDLCALGPLTTHANDVRPLPPDHTGPVMGFMGIPVTSDAPSGHSVCRRPARPRWTRSLYPSSA